eukprot:1134089-Amphidinium_carterae.1
MASRPDEWHPIQSCHSKKGIPSKSFTALRWYSKSSFLYLQHSTTDTHPQSVDFVPHYAFKPNGKPQNQGINSTIEPFSPFKHFFGATYTKQLNESIAQLFFGTVEKLAKAAEWFNCSIGLGVPLLILQLLRPNTGGSLRIMI